MRNGKPTSIIIALWMLANANNVIWAQEISKNPREAATQSAKSPMEYGKLSDGLRVGLVIHSEGTAGSSVVPGGKIPASIILDNQHGADVDLTGAFAWVFVGVNKETGYFTEKVRLDAPAGGGGLGLSKLAGESQKQMAWELADLRVFAYDKDLKMAEGYPISAAPAQGALTKVLPVGSMRLRVMVYVPATKTLVQGNTVKLTLGEPSLADLSPEQRQALVAALLVQFHGDAFAGDAAHKRAVRLGKDLLPDLLGVMEDPKLSDAGQQWLAASVCDLAAVEAGTGGAMQGRAVDKLCRWLEQSKGAGVIAYYGPRVKNRKLDQAILAAAGDDPGVAAWAARGYASRTEGGKVRADLSRQVLAKGDAPARANLAEALVISPGKEEIAALAKLLEDKDAQVRVATAGAIQKAQVSDPALIAALVKTLDHRDGATRGSACEALNAVARRVPPPASFSSDVSLSAAQKEAIVAGWREWYAGQKH